MHANAAHDYEETARQTKRLLEAIMGSINDPLLVFDLEWKLLMANHAAERAFDFTASAEASIDEIIASETLIAFARQGQPLSEWSLGDRTFVPVVNNVLNGEEQAVSHVLLLRDITHYKRLTRNQNEFIHIVAHDLRSPLTYMQGFASMVSMVGELNERQTHFVEKVLSGISQIEALVDNISDAGRFDMETGFYEMSRSHCDLREMVQRIVDNHLIPDEKDKLTVTIDVADDVPIINADANMLERALTNLYDNAIKYTPNGGAINVRVFCENKHVVLCVADNGLGISEEDQRQLFQRHVRLAREEYRKIKGSGLGLFIVKSVAQRHGGDAWVQSAPEKGSRFCFSIPLSGNNLIINDTAPQA